MEKHLQNGRVAMASISRRVGAKAFVRQFPELVACVVLAVGCSNVTGPGPVESTEPSSPDPARVLEVRAPSARPVVKISEEEWHTKMARMPQTKPGCFEAHHPSNDWVEVPCVHAPSVPFRPRRRFVEETVGAGSGDTTPVVPLGLITWAEGSFPSATASGAGAFSLQLNTNLFPVTNPASGTPTCLASNGCRGWQQFLFAPAVSGHPNTVHIQNWLIGFGNSCPSGWFTDNQGNCGQNSFQMAAVPPMTLSQLGSMTLTATTGATDTVTVNTGQGTLFRASQPSFLGLGASGMWTTAEFNVFGDGAGRRVTFDPGSTVVVRTVTSSSSGTRSMPNNLGGSFTAETNNLTLVPGSVCPFGGDTPGIQFMESNIVPTPPTPPACPSLALTPSPVRVPAGFHGASSAFISGNLVGQTSNNALLPFSCMATVSDPSITTRPVSGYPAGGIGPYIDYTMPWDKPIGQTFSATVDCDNGQSATETLQTVAPVLTANPPTLQVLQNGCASNQYAYSSLQWANPDDGNCDSETYDIVGSPPAGVTADTQWSTLEVCASPGAPSHFDLLVSTNSCAIGPATVGVHVDVVSCIPQTTCGRSCSATMSDGCGGTIDCSSNCSGVYSCTAPQGSSQGLLCCGPGQYIPAGGTSCVCPNGETWDPHTEQCVPPPPTCNRPLVYCTATGTCLTPAECRNATGCTPAQARAHQCM